MARQFALTISIALAALAGPRVLLAYGEPWLSSESAPGWLARLTVGISAGQNSGLHFDRLLHDFGTVVEGQSVVHPYRFRNVADRPIRILRVIKDCGCNRVVFPETAVPAGGEGAVEVELDTRNRGGSQTKKVTLITDEPFGGGSVLVLKGKIRLVLKVRRSTAAVRALRPLQQVEVEYEILPRHGVDQLEIREPEGSFYSARLEPEGLGWRLRVQIRAPAEPGNLHAVLHLSCRAAGETVPFEISLQAIVEPPLVPAQRRLQLRRNAAGIFADSLWISLTWPDTTRVLAVESQPSTLSTSYSLEGATLRIDVRCTAPPAEPGSITIHFRDLQGADRDQELSIPVTSE